jgi:hypothetical protein
MSFFIATRIRVKENARGNDAPNGKDSFKGGSLWAHGY